MFAGRERSIAANTLHVARKHATYASQRTARRGRTWGPGSSCPPRTWLLASFDPFVTPQRVARAPLPPVRLSPSERTPSTAEVTNLEPYISATVREVRDVVGMDEPDEEGEGNDVVSSDVSCSCSSI